MTTDDRTIDGRSLWSRRLSGAFIAAVPSVAFVLANAATSLYPALAVAGLVAVATFGWQLHRKEPLTHAVVGLIVVSACVAVAAFTGQARGFFLLPMLVPFTVVLAGVVSLLANKPLTGLMLNRISGGPVNWREVPGLKRVYTMTTLATVLLNVVSAAVQLVLYAANEPVALAGVHLVTGPANAAVVVATIVLARRALTTSSRTISSR